MNSCALRTYNRASTCICRMRMWSDSNFILYPWIRLLTALPLDCHNAFYSRCLLLTAAVYAQSENSLKSVHKKYFPAQLAVNRQTKRMYTDALLHDSICYKGFFSQPLAWLILSSNGNNKRITWCVEEKLLFFYWVDRYENMDIILLKWKVCISLRKVWMLKFCIAIEWFEFHWIFQRKSPQSV